MKKLLYKLLYMQPQMDLLKLQIMERTLFPLKIIPDDLFQGVYFV